MEECDVKTKRRGKEEDQQNISPEVSADPHNLFDVDINDNESTFLTIGNMTKNSKNVIVVESSVSGVEESYVMDESVVLEGTRHKTMSPEFGTSVESITPDKTVESKKPRQRRGGKVQEKYTRKETRRQTREASSTEEQEINASQLKRRGRGAKKGGRAKKGASSTVDQELSAQKTLDEETTAVVPVEEEVREAEPEEEVQENSAEPEKPVLTGMRARTKRNQSSRKTRQKKKSAAGNEISLQSLERSKVINQEDEDRSTSPVFDGPPSEEKYTKKKGTNKPGARTGERRSKKQDATTEDDKNEEDAAHKPVVQSVEDSKEDEREDGPPQEKYAKKKGRGRGPARKGSRRGQGKKKQSVVTDGGEEDDAENASENKGSEPAPQNGDEVEETHSSEEAGKHAAKSRRRGKKAETLSLQRLNSKRRARISSDGSVHLNEAEVEAQSVSEVGSPKRQKLDKEQDTAKGTRRGRGKNSGKEEVEEEQLLNRAGGSEQDSPKDEISAASKKKSKARKSQKKTQKSSVVDSEPGEDLNEVSAASVKENTTIQRLSAVETSVTDVRAEDGTPINVSLPSVIATKSILKSSGRRKTDTGEEALKTKHRFRTVLKSH